jgi:histidyl-tRNA synthetase
MENKMENKIESTTKSNQPPKGVRIRTPSMVYHMSQMIDNLKSVMKLNYIEERDYSVFEQSHLLLDKYGEDEKLIYELKDQGGQMLSLRYDLTTQHILYENRYSSKTFQVGKSYRRENNSNNQQRFREFYQFDVDFKNISPILSVPMILQLLYDCLHSIDQKNIFIKINDRQLLNRILIDTLQIKKESLQSVCSSIDKLDKIGWDGVCDELISKGITNSQDIKEKIQSCDIPQNIVDLCQTLPHIPIVFSPTLVRGLSYYTGIIFEVCQKSPQPTTIGGGGEYKEFIGFSIGLDRCLNINTNMTMSCQKYILAVGKESISVALKVAEENRKQNIIVDIIYLDHFKQIRKKFGELKKQFPQCQCAILAENELKEYKMNGTVQWK